MNGEEDVGSNNAKMRTIMCEEENTETLGQGMTQDNTVMTPAT